MKDGDYDLKVLFELRKKERDQAEKRYAEELKRHGELESRVQQLIKKHQRCARERIDECRRFDAELMDRPCTAARIQEFDRYVAGLRAREEQVWDEVEATRQRQRDARRKMERAHEEMLQALRDLKAVEKHYEKWRCEQSIAERRREAAKMDDVAARLWRDKQG